MRRYNYVTCVIPEKANASDQNAVVPVLEKVTESGSKPEVLLGDGGYGSDENVRHAAEEGVKLIAPADGKKTDGFNLEDFEFDEHDRITRCPLNCRPLKKISEGGQWRILFAAQTCANCPKQKGCPAQKSGKYNYKIEYTEKDLRVARRRQYQQSEEFKEIYRMRGGIEGTFGREKHYGTLGRLRIRGQSAVYSAIYLIFAGHNIMQAARILEIRRKEARKRDKKPRAGKALPSPTPFALLKRLLAPLPAELQPGSGFD